MIWVYFLFSVEGVKPLSGWCQPQQKTVSRICIWMWPFEGDLRMKIMEHTHTHTSMSCDPLEQSGAFTNWSEWRVRMDFEGPVWGSGRVLTARTPQPGPCGGQGAYAAPAAAEVQSCNTGKDINSCVFSRREASICHKACFSIGYISKNFTLFLGRICSTVLCSKLDSPWRKNTGSELTNC